MVFVEPFVRVVKIAIPYWSVAIAITAFILSLVSSKFHLQSSLIWDTLANVLLLGTGFFIVVTIYLQIGHPMYSFGELLPSAFLAALMMSVGFLIFQRSNEELSTGVGVLTFVGSLVVFSPGIAAFVFGFPRILKLIFSF